VRQRRDAYRYEDTARWRATVRYKATWEGDMGTHKRRHVLSLPRAIAVGRRVVTVGGGAMVHPRRRGRVIGLQKMKLAKKRKKKKKEKIPVHYSSRRVNRCMVQRQQTNRELRLGRKKK
jgi:hypothetical protein